MAVKQLGNQGYVFGFQDAGAQAIAASIGLTPQKLDVKVEPELEAEGKDIYNRVAALVIDTTGKGSFTMEGYVTNNELFNAAIGSTFTFEGRLYIVKGRDFTVSSAEFKMGTMNGTAYPLITTGASNDIA